MLQQSGFPWYADFANYFVSGLLPPDLSYQLKKRFLNNVKSYQWDESYLYKMCSDYVIKRCIPDEEILDILQSYYAAVYGGHFGGHKTTAKVLQSGYYWPFIFKDTYEFVKYCDRCERAGNISKKHNILLINILEVELFDI